MEITLEQYKKIESSLPRQRGNVRLSNLQVLNAILYVAEHGGKWRGLPKRFGNWHSIYVRMNAGPRTACWTVCLSSCSYNRLSASALKPSVWTRPRSRFIPMAPEL